MYKLLMTSELLSAEQFIHPANMKLLLFIDDVTVVGPIQTKEGKHLMIPFHFSSRKTESSMNRVGCGLLCELGWLSKNVTERHVFNSRQEQKFLFNQRRALSSTEHPTP
jgi:hypothetical protein